MCRHPLRTPDVSVLRLRLQLPAPIQLGSRAGITSLQVPDYKGLAEREGFEPPVPFRVRRFSRPEPSTTRPPLRLRRLYGRDNIRPLLASLQQAPAILWSRQLAERPGMKFHDFVEVRQKIGQAVVARVGMILVFDACFLELAMECGRAFFESEVVILAAVEIDRHASQGGGISLRQNKWAVVIPVGHIDWLAEY
jgi:hypothetical protein